MELYSTAFSENDLLPKKFTCDGKNITPPLHWENVPSEAESLVLIYDDPDAVGGKTWTHWAVYNISPEVVELDEGIDELPEGAIDGINSWNEFAYGGACPPKGTGKHRYTFTLYALDKALEVDDYQVEELERAMVGHIITSARLVALYQRD